MRGFAKAYLDTIIEMLREIRDDEVEAIYQAATLLVDAIEQEKRIFAFGCSHSSLPVQDLIYRAGGLMLINPIYGPGIASLDTRPPTLGSDLEKLSGFARIILDNTPIREGDVLIVVSVSGRNAVPIEMAQVARERGIRVIGITSLKYSQAVDSRHSSGRKMYEFADVVLDNKVEMGDAVLTDERLQQKFVPASGVTSTAVLQALVAAVIEKSLERGITPPVYLAANVDGGTEHNRRLLERYKERIFYY